MEREGATKRSAPCTTVEDGVDIVGDEVDEYERCHETHHERTSSSGSSIAADPESIIRLRRSFGMGATTVWSLFPRSSLWPGGGHVLTGVFRSSFILLTSGVDTLSKKEKLVQSKRV